MDEQHREGLEQRAERAVRRGELLVALDAFERLLAERPEDERLRGKIESVRSLLQPSELVHRRRAEPLPAQASESALNDAEQGELHASNGRYELALQCYRRAVEAHPNNELLRERLAELFRLAPPGSRAVDDGLARAEPLEAMPPTERAAPAPGDARSSRAADATFRPVPASGPAAPGAPSSAAATNVPPLSRSAPAVNPTAAPARKSFLSRDPIEFLRSLLARIRSARR
jgi:tetratricopeptide (TPR) repeat protein